MPLVILQIVLECLKLFGQIIISVAKYNAEEYAIYTQRLSTICDLLKKANTGAMDVMDEKSYLSNKTWDDQKRYGIYKSLAIAVFNAGGGMDALKAVTDSGMGIRVTDRESSILQILLQPVSTLDKAGMVAQCLVNPVGAPIAIAKPITI